MKKQFFRSIAIILVLSTLLLLLYRALLYSPEKKYMTLHPATPNQEGYYSFKGKIIEKDPFKYLIDLNGDNTGDVWVPTMHSEQILNKEDSVEGDDKKGLYRIWLKK